MSVTWLGKGKLGRPPSTGYSVYVGDVHATFNKSLGYNLEGQTIRWGLDGGGGLLFAVLFDEDKTDGQLVRRGQTNARVLHRAGIKSGTRVRFNFDADRARFVERRREVVASSALDSAMLRDETDNTGAANP